MHQQEECVMIGVTEIMQMMGIGRDRAYEIIKRKDFPSIQVGRRYLVHKETFEKWLKGELVTKRK